MNKKKLYIGLVNWVLPILLVFPMIIFMQKLVDSTMIYSVAVVILIFGYYVFTFYRLESTLSKTHRLDIVFVPIIYGLMLIIVAVLFSTSLTSMNAFLNTGKYISSFDIFYYCMISLTSIGYGDLSPVTNAERMLAIGMSLVGTLHMVMFISVLVGKLSALKQQS